MLNLHTHPRIEVYEDRYGESVYVLNEAGTIRIADLGQWMTDSHQGFVNHDRDLDADWFESASEWVAAVRKSAEKFLALEVAR